MFKSFELIFKSTELKFKSTEHKFKTIELNFYRQKQTTIKVKMNNYCQLQIAVPTPHDWNETAILLFYFNIKEGFLLKRLLLNENHHLWA